MDVGLSKILKPVGLSVKLEISFCLEGIVLNQDPGLEKEWDPEIKDPLEKSDLKD